MRLPQSPRALHNGVALRWDGIPTDKRARFLHPGELEVIASLVRNAKGVVEFGCQNGRTARVLLDSLPSIERYVGVDVLPGYVPDKVVQRGEVPADAGEFAVSDRRFRLLIRPRGSFDLDALDIGQVDAAFIDGDHSRAGVTNDYALARLCVRQGGVIVFHDYHDRRHPDGTPEVDVADVLHELVAAGRKIEHVAGTWIAFERV